MDEGSDKTLLVYHCISFYKDLFQMESSLSYPGTLTFLPLLLSVSTHDSTRVRAQVLLVNCEGSGFVSELVFVYLDEKVP